MAMDGLHHLPAAAPRALRSPLICFSSTRWQSSARLRSLMSRFARSRGVFFLEEPVLSNVESLQIRPCRATGVQVVTPHLPSTDPEDRRAVLDLLLARSGSAVAWYATPEARAFSDHVSWLAIVHDCFEEPSETGLEAEGPLLAAADLVFVGGDGLYEARRHRHRNIHCLPGGLNLDQLEAARGLLPEPPDQIGLRRPLLGRFAPVDDRLDLELLAGIAALRPHWHFAMIGEIVTGRELPQADNIHWIGPREEVSLPSYLCHWDLAIMPLARGTALDLTEAARYLAAGRRVISTPVRDMARRFSRIEAVALTSTAEGFVAAAEWAMDKADISDWVAVDDMLAAYSWDAIHEQMTALLTMAEGNAATRCQVSSRAPVLTSGASAG